MQQRGPSVTQIVTIEVQGKHKLQKDFRTDGNALLVNAQMQEMEMVRQKVYQLEQTQIAIRQK